MKRVCLYAVLCGVVLFIQTGCKSENQAPPNSNAAVKLQPPFIGKWKRTIPLSENLRINGQSFNLSATRTYGMEFTPDRNAKIEISLVPKNQTEWEQVRDAANAAGDQSAVVKVQEFAPENAQFPVRWSEDQTTARCLLIENEDGKVFRSKWTTSPQGETLTWTGEGKPAEIFTRQ